MVARQVLVNTYPLIVQCKFSTFKEYRSKFPKSLGFLFNLFLYSHIQSSKFKINSLRSPISKSSKSFL